MPEYSFTDFLEMHQDRLNLKHIKQFDMIIYIKRIAQQDTQLMTKLIAYLITIEHKIESVSMKAEQFYLLFRVLYLYLQDAII